MNNTTNLGSALALLKADNNNIPALNGRPANKNVTDLRMRFIALHSAGKEARLFNNIPEGMCYGGKPFLAENTDFFLALFLNESEHAACSKLIKHLNDCYACFEIFTAIVRDYYRKYQEIQKSE